jgi:hypothetical protein
MPRFLISITFRKLKELKMSYRSDIFWDNRNQKKKNAQIIFILIQIWTTLIYTILKIDHVYTQKKALSNEPENKLPGKMF